MTPYPRRCQTLFFVVALAIAFLALGRFYWLPMHASLNINEGWNAGHMMRLIGPGSLYPAPDALIANNYPPLSYFLISGFGEVIGDFIVAGRIVSVLSVITTVSAIGFIVMRLSQSRFWAISAMLLFSGFVVTLLRNYLAMNDPQWLAQAVMTWAVAVIVPSRADLPVPAGRIILSAALAVAAGLIKHNIIALPLAVTIWFALTNRRELVIWVVSGAILAGLACATLYTIWGTDVFMDVLSPARSYSALRAAAHGAPFLLFLLPGLIASRPLLAISRDDRRMLLPLLALGTTIPIALVQRSGDGVDINATFETLAALAIAVPTACALRREKALAWVGVAALPALCLAPVAATASVREITGHRSAERMWAPFIAHIAATRGAVACDDQALCYWAGRQSALDFFATKQRLLKDAAPAFRTAIKNRAFSLIEMRSENPGWHENRLIPEVRKYYRTIYASGGAELLVPR